MLFTQAQKKLLRDRCNAHRIVDKRKFGNSVETITYIQLLELLVSSDCRCYWTGKPLTLNGSLTDVSIDRLDNSLPHTLDNVVLCQRFINNGRGNTSVEEFTAYLASVGMLSEKFFV